MADKYILTVEDIAALQTFAENHGRRWKHVLRETYWYNARPYRDSTGRVLAELHALRNHPGFGHEGLERFTFLGAVNDALREVGVNVARTTVPGEYRVNFITGGTPESTAYTDCIVDAFGTGYAMARWRDERRAITDPTDINRAAREGLDL